MRTIEDFISYASKGTDGEGNDVYLSVFMLKDCSRVAKEGSEFYAVKWNDQTREARFYKSEAGLNANLYTYVDTFRLSLQMNDTVSLNNLNNSF